jgi:Tfp pilus assembly protein PilF
MIVAVLLGGCQDSSHQDGTLIFSSAQAERRAAELTSALESQPDDPNLHVELGRILLSEEYPGAAIREFERALRVDPQHVQACLLLSLALQKQPRPDMTRVTELLHRAVQVSPRNAQAHLSLAQVCDKRGQSERAADEFRTAIALSNDQAILVSAHLGLMALYKKQGEMARADEEYEAACRIYPGVKDMIVQAEINRSTPPPRYPGDPRHDGKGLHPRLETRMERAKEAISEMDGDQP